MKTMLTARILMMVIAGFWMVTTAWGQITFVKTSQAPATPANRQTQQGGLSPEKKKSLSKYGPEDAFPGASEQENQRRQTNRTNPRRSGATASPTTTPTPAATPTPAPIAVTPSPAISVPTPATKTNNPASASATSSTPNSSGSGLVLLTLATASLLVFGALVYVVRLLRNKLKETR